MAVQRNVAAKLLRTVSEPVGTCSNAVIVAVSREYLRTVKAYAKLFFTAEIAVARHGIDRRSVLSESLRVAGIVAQVYPCVHPARLLYDPPYGV